jgi:nitroreductase
MDSHLGIEAVLTTTRAVRKRLDFTKPVERKVIEECLAAAQQAPNGGNLQTWGFVVITDRAKRAALADLYRRGYDTFVSSPIAAAMGYGQPHARPAQRRVMSSIDYLVENLHRAPVFVIPCIAPRAEGLPTALQHAIYGSIMPAAWSFMLAARARGLGACWTIFHLYHEEEAAKLLGIPYGDVMQVALIPVAHAHGREFRPGSRQPVQTMIHWETWKSGR